MNTVDQLTEKINLFNKFCNQDSIHLFYEYENYSKIINDILRTIRITNEFPNYYVLLYTESLFDAINTFNEYTDNFKFIDKHSIIEFVKEKRNDQSAILTMKRNKFPPTLTTNVSYRTEKGNKASICKRRNIVNDASDIINDDYQITDINSSYNNYGLNLFLKELMIFAVNDENDNFEIEKMFLDNKKFFNKIAFIDKELHDNIFNFNIKRENIIAKQESIIRNHELKKEIISYFNIGQSTNDIKHWGNKLQNTVILEKTGNKNYNILDFSEWLTRNKPSSIFKEIPDDILYNIPELSSIFLNCYKRNNSNYKIYIPCFSSGYSSDLTNNSTISYNHNFSHNLFAGGYNSLTTGPIFYDEERPIYNEDVLKTFCVNYRLSSTGTNKLLSDLHNKNFQPDADFYIHNDCNLIERFYSMTKSMQFALNYKKQEATFGRIYRLYHKLLLFHGSDYNLFEDGNFCIVQGCLSCTPNIDVALGFTRNNIVYVYIIIINQGDKCPFINMGNRFREFALLPGIELQKIDEFEVRDLKWNGNKDKTINFVRVTPSIGNSMNIFRQIYNLAELLKLKNCTSVSTCFDDFEERTFSKTDNYRYYFNTCRNNYTAKNVNNITIGFSTNIKRGGKTKKKVTKSFIKNNKKVIKKGGKNPVDSVRVPQQSSKIFSSSTRMFPGKMTPGRMFPGKMTPGRMTPEEIKITGTKMKYEEYQQNIEHFNSLEDHGAFKSFKTKSLLDIYINKTNKIYKSYYKSYITYLNNLKNKVGGKSIKKNIDNLIKGINKSNNKLYK
jgi:hypothetical protein